MFEIAQCALPANTRPRPTCNVFARQLAEWVVNALIDEVTLTPKPGLVDMRSRGAHHDLSWSLMCASAHALQPTFMAMAEAGRNISDLQVLRERIGRIGRHGEATMMACTSGVNTHRGAIWALGLLVTAAAQDMRACDPLALCARAAALASAHDRFAPVRTGNKGEQACLEYGITGAKGEAQAGFPHVTDVGLPMLAYCRQRDGDERAARLHTLLAIISKLDDTCVLARGGRTALRRVQEGAHGVLAAGGVYSPGGKQALREYEKFLIASHLSPGGAADLLAATLFTDRVVRCAAMLN